MSDTIAPAHLRLLRQVLSCPTAPFLEQAVIEYVRRWAAQIGMDFSQDAAGNILLRYRRGRAAAQWVFAAHMDHPGFCTVRQRGRQLRADFRGSVQQRYFVGSGVRFFALTGQARGTIRSVAKEPETPWLSCRIELDQPFPLPPGTLGMWDLPAWRLAGRRLASRCCDDVAGTASVLCAMQELAARKINANVIGFLTRAEEAAFIGAMAGAQAGSIPKTALVVAIETSMSQPGAKLGSGVVVRVGDRVRTFDPSLTAHVAGVAERLAARDKRFGFTRQLMPGGTCESSAYAMWGHVATGLCIPLGNYHNQGPRGRIAAERIDLGDFENLVKLLVGLAEDRSTPARSDERFMRRLRKLLETRGKYL